MKKLLLWVVAGIFALSTTVIAKHAAMDEEKGGKQTKEEKQLKKELAKQKKEQKKLEEKAKKDAEKVAKSRKADAKKHEKKATKEKTKKVKPIKAKKEKKPKKEKKAKPVKKEKAKKEKKEKVKKAKKVKPAKAKKEKKAKPVKKEKVKKEKNPKKDAAKDKRAREKELKNIDKQKRAEEKKAKKELDKKLQKDQKEQKKIDEKLKKQNKLEIKQEKSVVFKQKKNEKKAEDKSFWAQRKTERREKFHDRKEMMEKWSIAQKRQVEADKKAGKLAYLYKEPAWPTRAQFYENKDLLNITLSTRYASDAFVGTDMTTSHDISKLAFGDKTIKVRDILLASKLVADGKVTHDETIFLNKTDEAEQYLNYLSNEVLNFNGWTHHHELSFGLSRYIWSNNLAIGVEMPVVYKKNHLELNMQLSSDATNPVSKDFPNGAYNNGAYGAVVVPVTNSTSKTEAAPNAFLRRYGADPVRFVQDALLAKGMTEMGGSAMGLGDIECFINGQIKSILFDKMVLGLKCVFPTGKKATQEKLWAPDLGNGGFFEYGAFMSVMTSYKSYVNPHLMLEMSGYLPGNVDRRVPQKITQVAQSNNAILSNVLGPDQQIAFGNRVKLIKNVGFSEFDTTVKGFADNVSRVKITKGAEFKMRLGNIFENFISRSGFLDIFYDLRSKLKDQLTGLASDTYNLDILKGDSQEIEHRAGFDYSYQFDLNTRLRLGVSYVFAGKNVAKTVQGAASLSHSF